MSVLAVLVLCIGLYFWFRKRKGKQRAEITPPQEASGKAEIDGKEIPFAELMAEKDATELPTNAVRPVEMPAEGTGGVTGRR